MTNPDAPLTPANLAELLALEGFSLPEAALAGLHCYLEMLLLWNSRMNLIGANSWQEAVSNLIIDSLHLAPFLRGLKLPSKGAGGPECWDLGAGAGLPGIALRLLWQEGRYTMVEAREKRAIFLRNALARIAGIIPLPGTSVAGSRVETFFPTRPGADLVCSRAFMPWAKLLDLIRPWLAPDGAVLFLALEPVPETLPPGWRVRESLSYQARGRQRWFWALENIDTEKP